MKKLLVVIAILVAAAACGGAAGSAPTGGGTALSHGSVQSNGSSGTPTKISGQPDGTTQTNPSNPTTPPALQGPRSSARPS